MTQMNTDELQNAQVNDSAVDQKNRVLKEINNALAELAVVITQIFILEDGKLKQIGSGFYVELNDGLYLISAAHVFDDEPKNIRYVFNKLGVLQKVKGVLYKHIAEGKRDDDLKDIVAVKLSGIEIKCAIAPNMFDDSNEYKEGLYGFIGYPGTKNGQAFDKTEMKNRPYSYVDKSISASKLKSFAYDDTLNIMIRYDNKKIIQNNMGPTKGPRMKGISGGPVFYLTSLKNLLKWSKERIKLSGVVIHTVEEKKYMAAVRINVILERLARCDEFEIVDLNNE